LGRPFEAQRRDRDWLAQKRTGVQGGKKRDSMSARAEVDTPTRASAIDISIQSAANALS